MEIKAGFRRQGTGAEKIQEVMHHANNRPVQPLNARKVLKKNQC
jgi:carbonic anhydrase